MEFAEGSPSESLDNQGIDKSFELEATIEKPEKNIIEKDKFDAEKELSNARYILETGNIELLEKQIDFLLENESANSNEAKLILVHGYSKKIDSFLRLSTTIEQQKIDLDIIKPSDKNSRRYDIPDDTLHDSMLYFENQAKTLDNKRDKVIENMDSLDGSEYEQLLGESINLPENNND